MVIKGPPTAAEGSTPMLATVLSWVCSPLNVAKSSSSSFAALSPLLSGMAPLSAAPVSVRKPWPWALMAARGRPVEAVGARIA